ncbi:MAG TPA: DEAD/DEAH box helicase family protein, partial [Metalysinibacillus sp.]
MENVRKGLQRGFMDRTIAAPSTYTPSYITNNDQQQVLPTLLEQLKTCQSFDFSIAFITEQGLAMLKTSLNELHLRGVKGRIITSTYLSFNQPNVFRELLKLPNVEVRITNVEGFHAKGYIFKQQDHISFLVGSSNLTATALKKNYEWNVKLTSLKDGELVSSFVNAFEKLWEGAHTIDEHWLAAYRKVYVAPSRPEKIKPSLIADPTVPLMQTVQPNAMQKEALKEIEAVRLSGAKRALVVSATGTGKTYLSAFAVKEAQPERFLFIVHREQILRKACKDYEKIIGGPTSDFQLLTGNEKNYEGKYLFATIQTLAKDDVLKKFAADTFDYIIVDEVHRAGATTYKKVIEYFQPKFILGMTATPERTDDFNIFELFHYNVAYEIRLQEALEADMLSPFHYFGVTDIIGGEEDTTFTDLIEDERVNHVLAKAHYYGHCGDAVKGLVFCSSKEEARALSTKFTERGFPSTALTGEDNQSLREQVVAQLEAGEINYIFTVDIFNEGVDIPAVNQVILLRQTASSIVFIQQLGRGLRKHADKDFVTVLDFIGNYKNNYMIPIALSGDQTLNKDNARRQTFDPTFIKGVSTINFEEIARQRIYDSIKTASLSSFTNVKKAYELLVQRLGKTPKLSDFLHHHSVDPEVVITVAKNYPNFLQRVKVETPALTELEDKILTMLSVELLNGKRIQEIC